MSTVKIRNDSGGVYNVVELDGHALSVAEEIDLLDTALPVHYGYWEDANKLVTDCPTAQLYVDIQAGDITVTENKE